MSNFISNPVLLFSMPGGGEWILILLAILLFFGGKKIPELMRGVGRGVREFNDAKSNVKKEIEEEFTRSLEGYTVNKNKYPHLRGLDPKEVNEISSIIKHELNRNDKFYLHGDFNLI